MIVNWHKKNILNGWQEVSLGNVCDISAGGTPSTKKLEYWNGNIPWMNSGDLNKRIIFDVEGRITEKGLNLSSAKLVPVNSVLIGLAGQGKTRGTVAINKIELTTNQSVAFFMPKEINYKFLYFNLYKRYEELRQISAGDGGRGGLNLQLLKNLKIILPPLSEQKQIVKILEIWDKYLEKLSRKIEIKKNIKKGLMQRLLTGKVRLDWFSGEWESVKLGDVGIIRTSSVDKKRVESEKEVKLLNYMDVYRRNHISKIDTFQKVTANDQQIISSNLKQGDVLFTPSSETPDDIGYSAVVVEDLDNIVFSYHLMRFRPDKNIINYKFSAYCFKTYEFYLELWKKSQGATRFTLSKDALEKSIIKIPKSQKEQTAIAKILTTADEEIEALEKKKKIIEEQKKFLLNNLVTGKIRTV